jgi:hypothetical protein
VERVYGPLDHWPGFGSQSMVDHRQEQWPKLTGAWLASVPVRGTSPRLHKAAEGLRRPGISNRRRRWSEFDNRALEVWR